MNTRSYQLPALWWTLGWMGIALLLFLSLAPLPGPSIDLPQGDKFGHALAYTVCMLWFTQLCARAWKVATALILLGIVIEVLQGLTGYRHADVVDALANSVGVALGYVLSRTPLGRSLHYLDRRLASLRQP